MSKGYSNSFVRCSFVRSSELQGDTAIRLFVQGDTSIQITGGYSKGYSNSFVRPFVFVRIATGGVTAMGYIFLFFVVRLFDHCFVLLSYYYSSVLSTEPGMSSSSFVCSHSIDDLSHRDIPIDIMDPCNGYRQGGAAKQQSFDTVPYNQAP